MPAILLINTGPEPASVFRWGQSPLPVPPGGLRTMQLDEGTVPFVIPGPGGVPSHLPRQAPRLLFAGTEQGQAETVELWLDVPRHLDKLTFHASALPRDAVLLGWDEQTLSSPKWRCPGCNWMTAEWETAGRPGLLAVRIAVPPGPFRFTNADGLPLFLSRPAEAFPYAHLEAEIRDPETLRPMDGRVSLWRGHELLAVQDVLMGERARFPTIPSALTIQATRGIEYLAETSSVRLQARATRSLVFPLRRKLRLEEGWIWGDQHTHCYHNDGAHSPRDIARAARAQGLQYVFLSDSPAAFADGAAAGDETGHFLAMPGQEVDTPFCHCCGLNVLGELPHLPFGAHAERYPGPGQWLEAIARQREVNHPCLLQLNHPSHRPDVMERWSLGYFRSWWVADEHPEVSVVENFDFPSWFDRLSRGRHLTGAWNTDTHDIVHFPPGACRVGLFTHGRITPPAIIDAIRRGRAFCTRAPGALLYLEVEGKMPGDTVRGGSQLNAEIRADSAAPIQRIDIVQQGRVVYSIDGKERHTLRTGFPVERNEGQWLLALLYADAPYPENDHCGTPLDVSGVLAFTNPVYLQ